MKQLWFIMMCNCALWSYDAHFWFTSSLVKLSALVSQHPKSWILILASWFLCTFASQGSNHFHRFFDVISLSRFELRRPLLWYLHMLILIMQHLSQVVRAFIRDLFLLKIFYIYEVRHKSNIFYIWHWKLVIAPWSCIWQLFD